MFPWGSSRSHYGNERGQITCYRSLGKAGTKSYCSILWTGRLNKRNPQFSLQTSNKLLQRRGQSENSTCSRLCHFVSTNDAIFLFSRSEITSPPLPFYITYKGVAASYFITCQHSIAILPSDQSTGLIVSTLRVATTAEGYSGRQFVCVFQWVSIPLWAYAPSL